MLPPSLASATIVAIIVSIIFATALLSGCAASDAPLEVIEFESIDACSAYLPPKQRTKDNLLIPSENTIEIVSLNASHSLIECADSATSWRGDSDEHQPSSSGRRCRSACWFRNPRNETLKDQCFCLLDVIWMPRSDDRVDSARLVWPCRDDRDCSFNGRCRSNGRCGCSEGWKGPACGELDLLPVDRHVLGFRQLDADRRNVSSWGAPILFDEASEKWHGYASEMQSGCGINAWETNSRIVRIAGDSPYGPFERKEIVFPAFAHEPSVVRGPRGEWVMLFSSYRYNATGLAAAICGNCRDGVTPEVSAGCPFQRGHPKNLSHVFRQMMSTAESPAGPWSAPVEIKQLSQAWDWNTALTINDDGSAVALIRGGMTWHASNYSDPTTWRPVGSKHGRRSQGPGWTGVSVEDPFVWRSEGVYHALAHAFLPFYGVHAFAPVPKQGFDWSFPLNWTVTGVAYNNVVEFSDGLAHSYTRRERPHLVWGPGGTPLALSNGVQYTGHPNQAFADGTFTLVQPIKGTNDNLAFADGSNIIDGQ